MGKSLQWEDVSRQNLGITETRWWVPHTHNYCEGFHQRPVYQYGEHEDKQSINLTAKTLAQTARTEVVNNIL